MKHEIQHLLASVHWTVVKRRPEMAYFAAIKLIPYHFIAYSLQTASLRLHPHTLQPYLDYISILC